MTRTSRLAVSLAGLLLVASASRASGQLSGTYTLDPNGSGPRNYPTWGAAVQALAAGVAGPVVFQVAPVTFRETVVLNGIPGASFTHTITFVAPGAPAILDASGAPDTITLQSTAMHFVFRNLVVRGASSHALNLNGVNPYTPAYCRFVDMTFIGPSTNTFPASAALISMASHCDFVHCVFAGGHSAILCSVMTSNVFDRCEIDGLGAALMLVLPYTAHSYPQWAHDADNVWQNCFLHDCHPDGHAFYFDSQRYGGCGNMFWHNTIVVKTTRAAVQAGSRAAWTACQSWRNNIVVNLGTGPCVVYGYEITTSGMCLVCNDLDHNCYHAPSATAGTVQLADGSFGGSLAQWKTWLQHNPQAILPGGGSSYDNHSIEADPGLVRMTAPYDFHLRAGSPCLDRGTSTYVAGPWVTFNPTARVASDFEGQDRPIGCAVDIGADEGDTLAGSGTGRIGSAVALHLDDAPAAGLPYALGSSLGTGPIPIDTRRLGLAADALLFLSVSGSCPAIFTGYRGVLDGQGKAQAAIGIPNLAGLIGVHLHSAFVTVDAAAPSGIRSISNPFSFQIAK
ncbi:MAG: hypothetical protein JXQ29_00420 [Planctomycetes bacterium]|nr:hypothetical protein [Planctomycetota bacterium]